MGINNLLSVSLFYSLAYVAGQGMDTSDDVCGDAGAHAVCPEYQYARDVDCTGGSGGDVLSEKPDSTLGFYWFVRGTL